MSSATKDNELLLLPVNARNRLSELPPGNNACPVSDGTQWLMFFGMNDTGGDCTDPCCCCCWTSEPQLLLLLLLVR